MTVYYKIGQILLEHLTAILLQNATVITKYDIYYKMQYLLKIATVQWYCIPFFNAILNTRDSI